MWNCLNLITGIHQSRFVQKIGMLCRATIVCLKYTNINMETVTNELFFGQNSLRSSSLIFFYNLVTNGTAGLLGKIIFLL